MTTRRSWRTASSACVALAAFFFLFATYAFANTWSRSTSTDDPRSVCIELGITPEAIAALGYQGHQVPQLFENLDDASQSISSLRQSQDQASNLQASLRVARKTARTAAETEDQATAQSQADQLEAQLQTVHQNIQTLKDQIRSEIFDHSVDAATLDRVCDARGASSQLPVEFRFVVLTEEDLSELIPALAAERRAQARGQQPGTDTQLTLSRFRNLQPVLLARTNILYNLDGVRGAFNQ